LSLLRKLRIQSLEGLYLRANLVNALYAVGTAVLVAVTAILVTFSFPKRRLTLRGMMLGIGLFGLCLSVQLHLGY
jgi:hypothetical protein